MNREELEAERDRILAVIAKGSLNLETLETRNRDSLDFRDLAVWQIKAALQAAFEAGRDFPEAEAEGEGEGE